MKAIIATVFAACAITAQAHPVQPLTTDLSKACLYASIAYSEGSVIEVDGGVKLRCVSAKQDTKSSEILVEDAPNANRLRWERLDRDRTNSK